MWLLAGFGRVIGMKKCTYLWKVSQELARLNRWWPLYPDGRSGRFDCFNCTFIQPELLLVIIWFVFSAPWVTRVYQNPASLQRWKMSEQIKSRRRPWRSWYPPRFPRTVSTTAGAQKPNSCEILLSRVPGSSAISSFWITSSRSE